MNRWTRIVLLGMLAAVAVSAPSAQGQIDLRGGIHGVRLGDDKLRVRSVVGLPDDRRTLPLPAPQVNAMWAYYRPLLTVLFGGEPQLVRGLRSMSTRDRTPGGVGVGTRERVLRRTIPSTRCASRSEERTCWVVRRLADAPCPQTDAVAPQPFAVVTLFDIVRRRIREVSMVYDTLLLRIDVRCNG
jgi:hypothetical protein